MKNRRRNKAARRSRIERAIERLEAKGIDKATGVPIETAALEQLRRGLSREKKSSP